MANEASAVQAQLVHYSSRRPYKEYELPTSTQSIENERYICIGKDKRFFVHVRIPEDFDFKGCPVAKISVEIEGIKELGVKYFTRSSFYPGRSLRPRPLHFTFQTFTANSETESAVFGLRFRKAAIVPRSDLTDEQKKLLLKRGKVIVRVTRGFYETSEKQTPAGVKLWKQFLNTTKFAAREKGGTHCFKPIYLKDVNSSIISRPFGVFTPAKGEIGKPIVLTFLCTSKTFLQKKNLILPTQPAPTPPTQTEATTSIQPKIAIPTPCEPADSAKPESATPSQPELAKAAQSPSTLSTTPGPAQDTRVDNAALALPQLATQIEPDIPPKDITSATPAEATTYDEVSAPRRSGRIKSMPERNYKEPSPTVSEASVPADEHQQAVAKTKSSSKRKLAEMQGNCDENCDDEEPLPKQLIKNENAEDDLDERRRAKNTVFDSAEATSASPAVAANDMPMADAASNPQQAVTATAIVQATNTTTLADAAKEKTRQILLKRLDVAKLELQLMELGS